MATKRPRTLTQLAPSAARPPVPHKSKKKETEEIKLLPSRRVEREKKRRLSGPFASRSKEISSTPPAIEKEKKDELTMDCSICWEMFTDAVVLTCGHSFCAKCIQYYLTLKKTCPTCRTPCATAPIPNFALRCAVEGARKYTRKKVESKEEKPTLTVPARGAVAEEEEVVAVGAGVRGEIKTETRHVEVWSCPTCTYDNRAEASICEVCFQIRVANIRVPGIESVLHTSCDEKKCECDEVYLARQWGSCTHCKRPRKLVQTANLDLMVRCPCACPSCRVCQSYSLDVWVEFPHSLRYAQASG